jgi:hypothetical protein
MNQWNEFEDVLIETRNHDYRIAKIVKRTVVYNEKTKTYSQYYGDEFLYEDDVVRFKYVAE